MTALHFWKDGESAEDYEDASARNLVAHRLAVADGVSDSYHSGHWASLLVEAFVSSDLPADFPRSLPEWVGDLAGRWAQEELELPSVEPEWLREARLDKGAAATFLGVELRPNGTVGQPWTAVAVGDCVLLQVRNGALVPPTPFPSIAKGRTSSPSVLSTAPIHGSRVRGSCQIRWGTLKAGDRLLLATDTVGLQLASELSGDAGALLEIVLRRDLAAFREWVQQARELGNVENDDVTVLVLEVPSEPSATPVLAPEEARQESVSSPLPPILREELAGQDVHPSTEPGVEAQALGAASRQRERRRFSGRALAMIALAICICGLVLAVGIWSLASSSRQVAPSPSRPSLGATLVPTVSPLVPTVSPLVPTVEVPGPDLRAASTRPDGTSAVRLWGP